MRDLFMYVMIVCEFSVKVLERNLGKANNSSGKQPSLLLFHYKLFDSETSSMIDGESFWSNRKGSVAPLSKTIIPQNEDFHLISNYDYCHGAMLTVQCPCPGTGAGTQLLRVLEV